MYRNILSDTKAIFPLPPHLKRMRLKQKLVNNKEAIMRINYEIWKDITGYEGIYQISSAGRVKNIRTGRVLKGSITKCGYLMVILCTNCKIKGFTIHRLLGVHFINNAQPEVCIVINHK